GRPGIQPADVLPGIGGKLQIRAGKKEESEEPAPEPERAARQEIPARLSTGGFYSACDQGRAKRHMKDPKDRAQARARQAYGERKQVEGEVGYEEQPARPKETRRDSLHELAQGRDARAGLTIAA